MSLESEERDAAWEYLNSQVDGDPLDILLWWADWEVELYLRGESGTERS